MKFRKFAGMFLMASMFALTACGGNEKVEEKPAESGTNETETVEVSEPAAEDVEIDIMQFKVEIVDQLNMAIDDYTAENPNVKINIITVGGGNDYKSALKSQMASGSEPTIFNVDGPQAVEEWKDYVLDMSDTASAEAAIPALLSPVTEGDQLYGVPYNQEGFGLLYNKAIFEAAGVDASSITDLDSLKAAVEILDSKKEELGLEAVFAFPVKETWVTGLHLSNYFIQPELTGVMDTFNAKEIDFTYSNEFKEIFDLQNNYSAQPTVSLDYSTQVEELYSFGKVAIIQQGNWVYPTISEIDPEIADNTGIIPIPVGDVNQGMIPSGSANYWAVNKNSSELQIATAKDFLDWLNTSERGKEIVLNELKFVPAYSGYDAASISDPISQEVYRLSQEGKTFLWTFPSYPSNWGMGMLGAELQNYANGDKTWDETIETAKELWRDARQ